MKDRQSGIITPRQQDTQEAVLKLSKELINEDERVGNNEERVVAEADGKPTCDSGPGGGSKAEDLDLECPEVLKGNGNEESPTERKGMGSPEMRAMREKKSKMRAMNEGTKVPESEEDSENVSETGADAGAIEDLSSGGEEKQWATPRNDTFQDAQSPSLRTLVEATYP